jgi:hypothetical protein
MTDRVVGKLDLSRKLPSVAGWLALATALVFGPIHINQIQAQTPAQAPAANPAQSLADTWQGTLHAGRDLRTVVKISKADGGGYKAVFYSIDQGGDGFPVTKITLDGNTVKMTLSGIGTYEGKLSADGKTIDGTWTQGPPLTLNFTRATPETEWTIPPPSPKMRHLALKLPPSNPPNQTNRGSCWCSGGATFKLKISH